MYKIMLIEDDEVIIKELQVVLMNHSYASFVWDLKADIKEYIQSVEPHCILLDINLPTTDGFSICTQIRKFSSVPIIFVTSRNSDMDELLSMSLGGDDFITKPYNVSILMAHIASVLKRTYEHGERILQHKGVGLDIAKSMLYFQEQETQLTKNELRILHYLFLHKEEIVARDDLVEYLWDNKLFIDDNALSVNVTRIRNKLRGMGVEDFIMTKHRLGYWI